MSRRCGARGLDGESQRAREACKLEALELEDALKLDSQVSRVNMHPCPQEFTTSHDNEAVLPAVRS